MDLVTGREGKPNEDGLADLRRKRKHVKWKKGNKIQKLRKRKKTKDIEKQKETGNNDNEEQYQETKK